MKTAFLTVLLLLLPLSSAWANECNQQDPESILKEASYIGIVRVSEVIYRNADYSQYLILEPLITYKGTDDFKEKEVYSFSFECDFENLKSGQIRELSIFKYGEGKFSIKDEEYRLPAKYWKKFREQKEVTDFFATQEEDCKKSGGTWNFPYGDLAECVTEPPKKCLKSDDCARKFCEPTLSKTWYEKIKEKITGKEYGECRTPKSIGGELTIIHKGKRKQINAYGTGQ